LDTRNNQII